MPQPSKLLIAYVRFLQRWYGLVLLLLLGISVWAYFPTKNIFSQINTDLSHLLPDDHQTVQAADRINAKLAHKEGARRDQGITVVLEFSQKKIGRAALPEIAQQLMKSPYIIDAQYTRESYDFFHKHGLLYLSPTQLDDLYERIDREIQKRKLGNLYIDFSGDEENNFDPKSMRQRFSSDLGSFPSRYFNNADETVYSIQLYSPIDDANFSYMRKALNDVQRIMNSMPVVRSGEVQIYYSGGYVTRLNEYDTLQRDLKVAGIVSVLGISLLILWQFRRADCLISIFAPFSASLFWSFAIADNTIGDLNMITAFLFSILFGLGTDFGVHLLARYWEERLGGADVFHAIVTTLNTAGRSCVTAGLTTAPAFYLLMINDFKGFSEFGFIAGNGLIACVLAYITIFPCLMFLLESLGLRPPKQYREPQLRLLLRITKHAQPITVGFAVLAVGLVSVSAWRLGFEYDFKKLKSRVESVEVARQKMRDSVKGGATSAAMVVEHPEDIPALREQVKHISERPDSIVSSLVAYDQFVPSLQEQSDRRKKIAGIKQLLDDDALDLVKDADEREQLDEFRGMLSPGIIREQDVPDVARRQFFGGDGRESQVIYLRPKPDIELDDGRNAMQFRDEIGVLRANGREYVASSSSLIFADVLSTMLEDSKVAIPLSLGAVMIVLFIDFRRPRKVFLVLSPLLMGTIMMLGFMSLFDIKFNFYNMIVIPAVFGMGIDYGVHFYHRYLEGGLGSVPTALRYTGSTIFVTAATTTVGFSGLTLANHAGLQSLGFAACIGITSCMVAALVFFPALLGWMEKK